MQLILFLYFIIVFNHSSYMLAGDHSREWSRPFARLLATICANGRQQEQTNMATIIKKDRAHYGSILCNRT